MAEWSLRMPPCGRLDREAAIISFTALYDYMPRKSHCQTRPRSRVRVRAALSGGFEPVASPSARHVAAPQRAPRPAPPPALERRQRPTGSDPDEQRGQRRRRRGAGGARDGRHGQGRDGLPGGVRPHPPGRRDQSALQQPHAAGDGAAASGQGQHRRPRGLRGGDGGGYARGAPRDGQGDAGPRDGRHSQGHVPAPRGAQARHPSAAPRPEAGL